MMTPDTEKVPCFKKENKFIAKSGPKKRTWRSLKQILTAERALPWPNDAVLYYSINAPPTFKPTKKYSDISGLPAPYIDRHSKLYYSNAEEFATVRSLPMDITAGYLQLRDTNNMNESKKKCRQYNIEHLKYGFIPLPTNNTLPMSLFVLKRLHETIKT